MLFFTSPCNWKMALLQYFKRIDKPKVALPSKLNSLSECQLQQINDHIQKTVRDKATTSGIGKKWHHQHNDYSTKERPDISKYVSENGVTKACRQSKKICTRIHSEKTENRIFGCTRNKLYPLILFSLRGCHHCIQVIWILVLLDAN